MKKTISNLWKENGTMSVITNYDLGNATIYDAEVLKSNLCNYNDAYISFKNCAPFTISIINIDRTTTYDAEDLDLVMPIYNLIEYSSNYPETTRSNYF